MADYTNPGDSIRGDSIRVQGRKYSKWQLFQMSKQHKGSFCIVEKNAKATILKAYTNIRSKF
jgi:hypothetical protein